MFRLVLIILSLFALQACGSGGTVSAPVVLKTYSDGSGIVTGSQDFEHTYEPANVIIAASNVQFGKEFVGSSSPLSTSEGGHGQYFVLKQKGVASNGATLEVWTVGEALNAYRNVVGVLNEYVGISVLTKDDDHDDQAGYDPGGFDDPFWDAISNEESWLNLISTKLSSIDPNHEVSIFSAGSKPSNLPSGTFSYNGPASILTANEIGDGTVFVTANFDNESANIVANIPANSPGGNTLPYYFSANNIAINTSDGSFFTSSGSIGITGQTSKSASIKGYFAGSGATGVHGLAYGNSDVDELTGVFFGSR